MKKDVVEHLILDGFQDNYCWRFHGDASSSHNLTREDIELDECYDYHDYTWYAE